MNQKTLLVQALASIVLLGCANQDLEPVAPPPPTPSVEEVAAVMKASFEAKGQATLERLNQDETQEICTRYAGQTPPPEVVQKITQNNTALIQQPADRNYLGDWKAGEKIAQTGTGKQSSDDPAKPSGGNCYACHQITKAEVAYGTLGPSLYQYGKLRGTSDAILKYTWSRLYDSDAFTACSIMPRFGHMVILTQTQMKDVMALLFDPNSPVNE